jgi:hypothetical protein
MTASVFKTRGFRKTEHMFGFGVIKGGGINGLRA